MAKKDGSNGKKIGRHSRNPSSKMQASRSAANKARRIKKFGASTSVPVAANGSTSPMKRLNEMFAFSKAVAERRLVQRTVRGRSQDERGIWRATN